MQVRHKSFNGMESAGMVVLVGALATCAPYSPNERYDVSPEFIIDAISTTSATIVTLVLLIMALFGWHAVRAFEKKFAFSETTAPADVNACVPPPMYRRMQLIYPTILAIIETLGASSVKCLTGMAQTDGFYKSPVFWVSVVVWGSAFIMTMGWLRFVYQRFPTHECLPTEIGLTVSKARLHACVHLEQDSILACVYLGLCFVGVLWMLWVQW
jgi:hypothetical protein